MSWGSIRPKRPSRFETSEVQTEPGERTGVDFESIRWQMLDALANHGVQSPRLTNKLRRAANAESLWYLRGELMTAIAHREGERNAQACLAGITQQFRGLERG